MGEKDYEVLYEIRDRLVRMETKMEGMSDVKKAAFDALHLSETNREDIKEIKEENKERNRRTWGAIWTLIVGFILQLLAFFLRMKGGE